MRLFVAAWPPASVVDDLCRLARPADPGVRWTTADQWHVTLRFVGEVGDPDVLTARLQGLTPPAEAEIGPESLCLGPSVLCLPVGGLDALAGTVRQATADIGERAEPSAFRGHLTLARARRGAASSVLRRLPTLALAARWPVEEVTIVASERGGTGSAYTVVGRVPLVASPPTPPDTSA